MDCVIGPVANGIDTLNTKRWIHLGGGIVVLVSLGYVGQRLWTQVAGAKNWDVSAELLIATGIGSLVYAAACLLLVGGWRRLVHLFGDVTLPFKVAASLYARSQIAKYVPGNVLHIAARHALGRSLGVSHSALALAALGEIAGLIAAASALGIFAASVTQVGLASWLSVGVVAGAIVFAAILPACWNFMRRWYPRLPTLSPRTLRLELMSALALYLAFFALAGFVLLLLVFAGGRDIELHGAAVSLSVFALSWIAGFLTPGAPAGLGVREAIMILALERLGFGSQSFFIALLFRVSTTCGDMVFLVALLGADRATSRKLGCLDNKTDFGR